MPHSKKEARKADIRAFRRSLRDHPGLGSGFLWPLLVLVAVAGRKDFIGFSALSVAAWCGTALIAALPWVPILWTAWSGRHQYKDDGDTSEPGLRPTGTGMKGIAK